MSIAAGVSVRVSRWNSTRGPGICTVLLGTFEPRQWYMEQQTAPLPDAWHAVSYEPGTCVRVVTSEDKEYDSVQVSTTAHAYHVVDVGGCERSSSFAATM